MTFLLRKFYKKIIENFLKGMECNGKAIALSKGYGNLY